MMEPLGHISEYGLKKLRTRRHYCVTVSYLPEKEYTIGIVRLSDAEARIAEWERQWQMERDLKLEYVAAMKAAEARANAAEALLKEARQALDEKEIASGLTSDGNLWRYWAAKAKDLALKNAALERALKEKP